MSVVGESSKDLFMVLEEKWMVAINAIENEHIERVYDIFARHVSVKTKDNLFYFCLCDI